MRNEIAGYIEAGQLDAIGKALDLLEEGGGDALRARGIDLYSLAIIEEATPDGIRFREQ